MPLDKNQIPIAMGQGLDTKTDPKQVVPGKFLTLENAVFLKNGQIQKCNGYADKNAVLPNDTGLGCATLKNSLFMVGETNAYSYSPSRDSVTTVGKYLPITVSKSNAINQDAFYASCAYDSARNTLLYVWQEYDYSSAPSTKIKYSAIDLNTNSICCVETYLDVGTKPRVVTSPAMDYFLIVYEDTVASPGIKAVALSKADLVTYTQVQVDTNPGYSGNGFSLLAYNDPYICWSSGAASANTKIGIFSNSLSSFVAPTTVTIAGTSCINGSAIITAFGQIIFAVNDSVNVKTFGYNYILTAPVAALRTVMTRAGATTLHGVVMSFNENSNLQIFTTNLTGTAANQMPKILQVVVTATTTVTAQRDFLRGAVIAGNLVLDNQTQTVPSNQAYYLPVSVLQSYNASTVGTSYNGVYTHYLIRASVYETPFNQYVAAKFYDLNAAVPYTTAGHPNYITFVEGLVGYYGLVAEAAGNSSQCYITFANKPVFAELANNLHVTGGYLGMYDGAEFAEHNFFQQPVQPLVTQIGPGPMAVGFYYYSITYEWQDAYGQIHESSPSDPVAFQITTVMGASSLNIACPTLKLTNKSSQVYIAIYRSSDGFVFYREPNTGIKSNVQSQKNFDTFSVSDNYTNAQLLSQPILYTSGGEVNNASAPACTFVSNYKRRLIVVPSEDLNSVWYSKDITPPTAGSIGTPVNFATEFVLSVDERGGGITGTIQLDDKLLMMKSTSISVLTGEGPANNGTQNDFSTPQIVATDTGALYGRSLVLTPLGIMFQAPKGYYLIDRSLSVSYVGAPVENFNTAECLVAILMYDRNEVWFGTNTSNNVLIYNYYFNQWSSIKVGLTHACVFQNKFTALTNNLIRQETPGAYQRNGVGYAMKATTGWLSFAQLQGFQRVYKLMFLGDYKSAHRIQVDVSVDFDDTVVQTSTITATSTPPYQYRVFMTRQKCESIKFTIQDLAPVSGSWTEAYTLGNMAFEVGIKRGLNKLPATKSVG